MNYRIAKTSLVLCTIYLFAFYILKIFYPELLIQSITHPTLISFGNFMNKYPISLIFFQFISSFITFYLFACASSGKLKFNKKQIIWFLIINLIDNISFYLLPQFYTHTCTSLMLVMACIAKGNIYYTTISFTIHGFLSHFLTNIRGFSSIAHKINAISGFVIGTEGYIWLISLALIFNLKEKKNGTLATPLCEQA